MKNSLKILSVAMVAFGLGLVASNYAMSDVPANFKVAVVDVQKVVANSSQVKALKDEQKKKGQELAKFIETAKTNITKETDEKKKKALEEKYNKEFQTKREAIAKNYETKLLAIDKNISNVIDENAKANGYNLVLAKGVVLSGGTDITAEITKAVK
ncbi:MAG: OmpH family outer membrane protein [Clostridia bacterium]|nr:OmpH family outer membrane protein [Clostridia bacterium]MBQ8887408.1 OmpH family outer membrane protein [Candidatus Gastranaerophilales bacterium]